MPHKPLFENELVALAGIVLTPCHEDLRSQIFSSSNLTSGTAPTYHFKFRKSLFSCAMQKLSLLLLSIDFQNSSPLLRLDKFVSQERLSSSREKIEFNDVDFRKKTRSSE
jgi:hypothetical protein